MIAIIDYDAGNLKSVEKALWHIGEEAVITREPAVIRSADHVILPGVGAFGDAMEKLHKYGLVEVIHEIIEMGTPFLGICLGLQLLFERSEEGNAEGLSILKGQILKIPDQEGLKIPHMGWNSIKIREKTRLFEGIPEDSYVYFVHSYYLKAKQEEEGGCCNGIWCKDPCLNRERKYFCMSVPPRKERGNGLADFTEFCKGKRGIKEEFHVYKTNYPLFGCK